MKTIIVCGAGKKVGKTTVLRKLSSIFKNNICVKLGCSKQVNNEKPEMLLPSESSLDDIKKAIKKEPEYLLIEGNSILKNFQPDLAIFVDGETENKREDADELKSKSDLVVGEKVDCANAFILAGKLGMNRQKFGQMLNQLNIKIKNCQLGCF